MRGWVDGMGGWVDGWMGVDGKWDNKGQIFILHPYILHPYIPSFDTLNTDGVDR
ncbi:MAG: hypothetical protein HC769_16710 [Cyanobacteria bacterium CRU_2_1]|nr:hypothetical protein [Cyanobacteria bacterium RU_5_0]NJR60321.1 hypothetical protein [Cyanobacteria bacterium CRU_2_1]